METHPKILTMQKQPPLVFSKKTCSWIICNIHKKTLSSLQLYSKHFLLQLNIANSCEYCEIFKNTFYEEHLRTAASIIFSCFHEAFVKNFMKKLWFSDNQIKTNHDKCCLSLTGKTLVTTNIGEIKIENTKCEKLLGIKVDCELKYKNYLHVLLSTSHFLLGFQRLKFPLFTWCYYKS